MKLQTSDSTIDHKIARMNDLLRTLEGQTNDVKLKENTNENTLDVVVWMPVYGINHDIEKISGMLNGIILHTLHLLMATPI